MKTTKSPLTVAKRALELASECLPDYSCPKSPRKFTQPQLVACLVVKEFLKLDYRGLHQVLLEWTDLRQVIGLTKVPHFTTLCAAHRRLLKKRKTHHLMDQLLQTCRTQGLLPDKSTLAAIDSTGLESRHVSHYFTRRSNRHQAHRKARYPKLSAVCDTRSHLILGITVNRGPKPDHCEFKSTVRNALRRQPMQALVGDAGPDESGREGSPMVSRPTWHPKHHPVRDQRATASRRSAASHARTLPPEAAAALSEEDVWPALADRDGVFDAQASAGRRASSPHLS